MNSTPSWKNWPSGIMLLLFVAPFIASAQSPVRFQQIDLVPEVGGTVEVVGTDGTVRSAGAFYQPSSAEDEKAPATSLTVGPGETIRTKKHAAIANLQGNGNMRLAPNSQVQLPKADAPPAQASLSLKSGRVMLNIALDPSQGEQEVVINGQRMSIGMKQGKLFMETGEDGSEVVGVHEGKAVVNKDGRDAEVGEGKALAVTSSGEASLNRMNLDQRNLGKDYPVDLLEWKEGLLNWRQVEWAHESRAKDASETKDQVRVVLQEAEISVFRDEKLGEGVQFDYETTQPLWNAMVTATIDKSSARKLARNLALAAEFWVQFTPASEVHFSSYARRKGGDLGKPIEFKITPGKWTRITQPLDAFRPEGVEFTPVTMQFSAKKVPADTEGIIRVIPGRVLVLKE